MTSGSYFFVRSAFAFFQLIFYLFLNNTTRVNLLLVPGLHFAPFLIALKQEKKEWKKTVCWRQIVSSIGSRWKKKFRDLSRSLQVDIANEIYGVMISFKPRKVSLFNFSSFSGPGLSPLLSYSRKKKNLEKCICCNLSICGLKVCENGNPLEGMKGRRKEWNNKIGKIKFMNIDYSRLGHRSRGLAAALSERATMERKEVLRNPRFKIVDAEVTPSYLQGDKFHSRFLLFFSFGKQSWLKLDSLEVIFSLLLLQLLFFVVSLSRNQKWIVMGGNLIQFNRRLQYPLIRKEKKKFEIERNNWRNQ